MADTFEKILVKDDTIGCLTNRVKYQVLKGGQNITSQPFNAISQSTSAHVYNITVPSLETIISREVLWQSTVTLKINLAIPNNVTATLGKPGGQFLVNYGVTDALAPFPLHSLVTNMTCTINNNTVSMNVQDTCLPCCASSMPRSLPIRVHDPDWPRLPPGLSGRGRSPGIYD